MARPNPNAGIDKIPRYLRPAERKIMEKTAKDFETAASSPYLQDPYQRSVLQRAHANARLDLESQTPPALSKTEEDRAAKRVKDLEEKIQNGMLSDEDMRRNPVGAVDHHIRWEKRNKRNIKEWKALQIALHPGADQADTQDLCNIERLRTLTSERNYHDAQIPRSTIYSLPPDPDQLGDKAGWPYLFDDSSERQIEEEREARLQAERELEELKQTLQAKTYEQPKERRVVEAKPGNYEAPERSTLPRKPFKRRPE